MAEDPAEPDECRARDLDLLRSGNFSDFEVVCGNRTWKCHQAILASRSVWFRKALSGPFEEANTRRVKLDKQDPVYVDLALKHIYGGGLDVESSVSAEHFVVECVSLYSLAELLKLKSLQSSAKKAVCRYCDKQVKQLCTYGSDVSWVSDPTNDDQLSPWALDLVLGLLRAYQKHTHELRDVLMEFIWVRRYDTLYPGTLPTILDLFKDEPSFVEDFMGWYATGNWTQATQWAEFKDHSNNIALTCERCGNEMPDRTAEDRKGRILNPFDEDKPGWCRDCGQLDMIPWRNQEANDG